jgi:hypothetical protein
MAPNGATNRLATVTVGVVMNVRCYAEMSNRLNSW